MGARVPVCDGSRQPSRLVAELRATAGEAGIPVTSCGANRSTDHWSFQQVGVPAARIGSTPWPGYHSARDTIRYVRAAQLGRAAELTWSWLNGLP